MITSELLPLILNKWAIGGLAGLIALIIAYFKGSASAKQAAIAAEALAERALNARLRAAEAKNIFLEKKGEVKREEINAADSIDGLIKLFNQINNPKSTSGDALKDTEPRG